MLGVQCLFSVPLAGSDGIHLIYMRLILLCLPKCHPLCVCVTPGLSVPKDITVGSDETWPAMLISDKGTVVEADLHKANACSDAVNLKPLSHKALRQS